MPEQTREKILALCADYFKEHSVKQKKFIPGQSYIPASGKSLESDDLRLLVDSCLDLWFTHGRYSSDFEAQLATWMQRSVKALFVNSGSSANLLALSTLCAPMMTDMKKTRLMPGDEVITVAAGFPTTVNPIVQNGLVPVFVDVEFATLDTTLAHIEAALSPKTRAVMIAHTLGNPFRADEIAAWCEGKGLYLIEDCCDALGATIATPNGPKPVGSFGHFSTLSFYPAHHITTGEGGAVLARDGRLRKVAESMRDWGRDCWCETGKDNTCGKRFGWQLGELPDGYDHKYTYSNVGYNLKSTDMQAALGVAQLKRAPEFIAARRRNWRSLYDGIQSSPLLRTKLQAVEPTPGTDPSWFGFALHCTDGLAREPLLRALEERKVGTRLVFAGNMVRQPAFKDVTYRVVGELKNTDEIMKRSFWIGLHPSIGQEQIQYMLETLEYCVSRSSETSRT